MSLQQCCRCPLPLTLSSAVRSEGREGPFLFLARTVNCHTPACRSVSWTTNGSAGVPLCHAGHKQVMLVVHDGAAALAAHKGVDCVAAAAGGGRTRVLSALLQQLPRPRCSSTPPPPPPAMHLLMSAPPSLAGFWNVSRACPPLGDVAAAARGLLGTVVPSLLGWHVHRRVSAPQGQCTAGAVHSRVSAQQGQCTAGASPQLDRMTLPAAGRSCSTHQKGAEGADAMLPSPLMLMATTCARTRVTSRITSWRGRREQQLLCSALGHNDPSCSHPVPGRCTGRCPGRASQRS